MIPAIILGNVHHFVSSLKQVNFSISFFHEGIPIDEYQEKPANTTHEFILQYRLFILLVLFISFEDHEKLFEYINLLT